MNSTDVFAPILLVSMVLVMVVGPFAYDIWRVQAFESLADRYGLRRMDCELPGDFPTNMLDGIRGWGKAHNVIAGPKEAFENAARHDLLLAFEIEVGLGRNTRSRTIVARRSRGLWRDITPPKGTRLLQQGPWRAIITDGLFGPYRLSMQEIERCWNLLQAESEIQSRKARS